MSDNLDEFWAFEEAAMRSFGAASDHPANPCINRGIDSNYRDDGSIDLGQLIQDMESEGDYLQFPTSTNACSGSGDALESNVSTNNTSSGASNQGSLMIIGDSGTQTSSLPVNTNLCPGKGEREAKEEEGKDEEGPKIRVQIYPSLENKCNQLDYKLIANKSERVAILKEAGELRLELAEKYFAEMGENLQTLESPHRILGEGITEVFFGEQIKKQEAGCQQVLTLLTQIKCATTSLGEQAKKSKPTFQKIIKGEVGKSKYRLVTMEDGTKQFGCPHCDYIVSDPANLKRHLCAYHRIKDLESPKDQPTTKQARRKRK